MEPWALFFVAIAGVRCLGAPKQSPSSSACAEPWVWTIGRECLNKTVPFDERHVRCVVEQYVEHYGLESPRSGGGCERRAVGGGAVRSRGRAAGRAAPGVCYVPAVSGAAASSSRNVMAGSPTTPALRMHWRYSSEP